MLIDNFVLNQFFFFMITVKSRSAQAGPACEFQVEKLLDEAYFVPFSL